MKNKHGIAIWADKGQPDTLKPVELHVNVWKLSGEASARLIDIGIMLFQYSSAKTINIFIPFERADSSNFSDLGEKLRESKMCSAVFNELCKVDDDDTKKFLKVTKRNTDPQDTFYIYTLDCRENGNVKFKSAHDGTIVKISIPELSQASTGDDGIRQGKVYIRFRLSNQCVTSFYSQDDLAHAAMQNFVAKVEILDIRFNEVRTLDRSINEYFESNTPLNFSKVQFFFMCRSTDELILAKTAHVSARNLEKESWESYLPENAYGSKGKAKQSNNIIAYQWRTPKEGAPFCDYSMMIKTRYDTFNIKKVVALLLVTILIGALGSELSTQAHNIWDYFNKSTSAAPAPRLPMPLPLQPSAKESPAISILVNSPPVDNSTVSVSVKQTKP